MIQTLFFLHEYHILDIRLAININVILTLDKRQNE